ncbi:heavy metal-associated isoprenylated plant protein 5-like [Phoenix dactylifera]|uniref:Heavy metal-associated isoprenylated plant protein 5-like n=1 Tax=Phoenix dactylifera TaxID=42345 RepID=A0A8B7CBM9_PHODC|nr:heavy metal-associated isoprenylated plant protein 5-like [Phoenix dactylifera]
MLPELEKARVTELHVRMDCNGCVQKIKKVMHGIDGVYDVYVDSAQQKLTVVGRADPEKIVKAIKKTGKIATICSHTEQVEPSGSEQPPPSTEAAASSNPPSTEAADQPPSMAPPAPPGEPPQEAPPEETKAPEINPSPEAKDATPTEPRDVEEIHMVHHYPQSYIYREHWNQYPTSGHEIRHEAPYHDTHSYSSYRPSPYVTGYGHLQSPPQDIRYSGAEAHHDGYYHNRGAGDGNQMTSIFSDENPNACRIV